MISPRVGICFHDYVRVVATRLFTLVPSVWTHLRPHFPFVFAPSNTRSNRSLFPTHLFESPTNIVSQTLVYSVFHAIYCGRAIKRLTLIETKRHNGLVHSYN
jgi:hypothetical protein